MAKFSLSDLLNTQSKPQAVAAEFKIEKISVYQLEPSKDNFYSVADTDDLKDSIELIGIQQNLTVTPIPGTDNYKVISGHRRRIASMRLADEGKEQFEFVPCRIENNLDEIKEKIMLIYTNSTTRKISDWEKVEQLAQLKALLQEYKKTHEIPGRVRELLAEALNVSPTQVERLESIDNNLVPEFKEEFKQGNVKVSVAAELSKLSAADQKAVYETHKEKGATNLNAVRAQKEKVSKPQEAINPTITALTLVKDLLEKEIARIRPDDDKTVLSEYYRILTSKAREIDQELHSLMGSDMFKECSGAAE
ncbi:MAG: ParB domain protein nuclease [Caproiciproducens sp.]|jgi:ParB family chromosome partitioning protein|nr:ParB domain protein nuclease [Caproiciproducens sp.]